MPVLLLSDIHLDDTSLNHYRHDFISKQLSELIKKHHVDHLILLGDLTVSKDRHCAWLVNAIADHLAAILKLCPIIILKANHDYTSSDNPFFRFVSHFGIIWINDPTVLSISGLGDCLFLPHTHNPDKDWSGIDMKGYSAIFAHATFTGALGDNGTALSGISPSIFPANARVFSGDIHTPQTLKTKPPITYIGAPYRINFGDIFDPRMILLDGNKVQSIPIDGPQKHLIEITRIEDLDRLTDIYKGDIIKVRVLCTKNSYASLPTIRDQIRDWAHTNELYLHTIIPVLQAGTPIDTKLKKIDLKTDEQIIKDYAKTSNLDKPTTAIGIELMKES
jgi:predicted phosphodiesterase